MEKDESTFWRMIKNHHYRVNFSEQPCGHCELNFDCPFEDCGRYIGIFGYFKKK